MRALHVVLCLGVACGAPAPAELPDAGPVIRTGSLPCDVAAVLAAKCQRCHTYPPMNRAPWPLLDYADTQAPRGSRLRWQRMAEVIEAGTIPQMPPAAEPQLD